MGTKTVFGSHKMDTNSRLMPLIWIIHFHNPQKSDPSNLITRNTCSISDYTAVGIAVHLFDLKQHIFTVSYLCPNCTTDTSNWHLTCTVTTNSKWKKATMTKVLRHWHSATHYHEHQCRYLNLLKWYFKCEGFVKIRIQRFPFNCCLFLLESLCSVPQRDFNIWIWVERRHKHISHTTIRMSMQNFIINSDA